MRWPGTLAALALGLVSCTAVVAPDAVDAPAAPFGECTPPYAFFGETTLAAIGLTNVSPQEANRPGRIWITRDPVDSDVFAPGPPAGVGMPDGQVVCVEWADGSGMSTILPDAWDAPLADGPVGTDDGMPITMVGAVAAVLIVLVVSWLAFRREAPTAA